MLAIHVEFVLINAERLAEVVGVARDVLRGRPDEHFALLEFHDLAVRSQAAMRDNRDAVFAFDHLVGFPERLGHVAGFSCGGFVLGQLGMVVLDLMREDFVFDFDSADSFRGDLLRFGGDGGDDGADVLEFAAHDIVVFVRRLHAGHRFRRAQVNRGDFRASVRRPENFRPQQAGAIDVVGILRRACGLERAINAADAFADVRTFFGDGPSVVCH